MKIIQKTIFFTIFFSLYLPTLAHAAAEKPSTKNQRCLGGVPLPGFILTKKEQDQLNKDLHEGAVNNDPEKLSQALKKGAQVNCRGFRKKTALHYVIESADYKKSDEKKVNTQQLLSHKADINAQDSTGQTPLILSVIFQNTNMIQMLLQAKANTEIRDENDDTALTIGAHGYGCDSQLLIEWGAQPINEETQKIYLHHFDKHEKEPSAEVVEYKKKWPEALTPFVPVAVLTNLIMEYVPNLDIQISLNRRHTEKTGHARLSQRPALFLRQDNILYNHEIN